MLCVSAKSTPEVKTIKVTEFKVALKKLIDQTIRDSFVFDKKKSLHYEEIEGAFFMKKLFYLALAIVNLVYMTDLPAHSSFIYDHTYEENYHWDPTDANQKKQAVGMVVTGVFLFVAIALISGIIPSCAGDVAPFSQPTTGNTLLD